MVEAPFNMPDDLSKPPLLLDSRPIGIGLKPCGYSLGLSDYKAYSIQRDELLRGPVGRAALLHGGVVWRLAWGVVNMQEAIQGPDVEDQSTWSHMQTTEFDQTRYARTRLSPEDIYIICGTYRTPTCKS